MNVMTHTLVSGILPIAQQQQSNPMNMIGMMVIIFALFYVMIIRPQKRKEKERKALISSTESGDRVIFSGGIIGTVVNVKENTFVVRIADKVKIEILRGSVMKTLQKDEDVGADEDNK